LSPPRPDPTRVLLLHDRPEDYLADLQQRFPTVDFHTCTRPEDVDAALERSRPQAVFSFKSSGLRGPAHRGAVECPHVEWIQVVGAGFDHLQPVERDDLLITNCAGVLSAFMAETVLGAMLMLNVGFPRYMEQQRARHWQEQPWTALAGKTALVIGLGQIGCRVAIHARHLGMHVIGMRARGGAIPEVDELVTREQLPVALARADVICLHVPFTEETHNLLDANAFASMKRGALLVNTARGGVVDEDALLEALRDGTVGAAHCDVFESEPLPKDSPLWDAPNLVITPHMADTVSDYGVRFAAFFADNLERWLEGEPLHNVVDPKRGY
jgi:phosphoglycerate dehydrogenase-like enzyme